MVKNRIINHKLEQLEPRLLLSADGMVAVLAAPSPISFGFDSAIEQDLNCIELTGENDRLYSIEQTEASFDIFQFNEEGVRVERYQIESGFNSRPLRRRNNVNPYRGSNSRWKYHNETNREGPRAEREGSWETLPQLCCFVVTSVPAACGIQCRALLLLYRCFKRVFTRLIKLRPIGGVVYSEDVVTSYYAHTTQTHTDRLVETLHAANGPPGHKGVTGAFVYHFLL